MEFLNQKSKDLVNVFTNNLLSTNRSFNYYVNWANVDGYKGFLVEIHAIDVQIGCKDESFKSQFFTLISKLPNVRLLFPFLFGLAKSEREQLYRGKNKLKIIQHELDSPDYLVYSFSKTIDLFDENSIEMYYDFFVKMGLKNLYQNIIEKSTLDYIAEFQLGWILRSQDRVEKHLNWLANPLFENICCNCKYPLKLLVQSNLKD